MAPKKDKKPKKSTWKFNLDLTHPVEDGIFDSYVCISFGKSYSQLPMPCFKNTISSIACFSLGTNF
uniref:60S ribosomal protein L22-like 1 n=1 Tax=Sus scrofa TaxID=9823 RepID=A0A8D1G1B0_PIG